MSWSNLINFSAKFNSNASKSEYVEILAQYSTDVPSIEIRMSVLEKLYSEKNLTSKNWLNRNQFIFGIIYSTLTVKEFIEHKEEIYKNLVNIYNIAILKRLTFKFIDYIISSDWGKTLKLIQDIEDEILGKLVENEYYYDSDEFAALLLKLWVSDEGKQLIQKNQIFSMTEIFFFKLIDSMKGKTGGLLKEVGFALKGQRIVESFEKLNVFNLLKYIEIRKFDSMSSYYVILMALKVLPYDFTYLFNHTLSLNSKVKRMLVTQSQYPFVIFSLIQEKIITNGLKKYNFKHDLEMKLSDFYNTVLDLPIPKSNIEDGKVGVIITTYNPDITLFDLAVKSIAQQTYQNIQICVVDDCSPVEKRTEIKKVLGQYGDKVLYIENEKNVGQYASRNIAMENLKDCTFYAIQDDDDISHPQRIELQVQKLQEKGAQICLTEQVRFTENVQYVQDKMNPLSFDFGPATSLFRATLVQSIGGFSLVRTRGDVEFLKRIIANYSEQAVLKLSIPLYLMRYSTSSVSASKDYLLRTQLEVFRYFMKEGKVDVFINGQQYALNN